MHGQAVVEAVALDVVRTDRVRQTFHNRSLSERSPCANPLFAANVWKADFRFLLIVLKKSFVR
jgi:hypothetical protein